MLFKNIDLDNLDEVINYLLPYLKRKIPLLLEGELGSGKTTLVRMIGRHLNIVDNIKSPSFNKMNIYDNKIIHIDGYNLKGNLDAFEDYFSEKIIIIEWASNINHSFKQYISLNIENMDDNSRNYIIKEIDESNIRHS